MATQPNQTLTVIRPKPNQDVIRMLEDALLRARTGDTIAAAIVEVSIDSVNFEISQAERCYHFIHSGAQRLAAYLASCPDD